MTERRPNGLAVSYDMRRIQESVANYTFQLAIPHTGFTFHNAATAARAACDSESSYLGWDLGRWLPHLLYGWGWFSFRFAIQLLEDERSALWVDVPYYHGLSDSTARNAHERDFISEPWTRIAVLFGPNICRRFIFRDVLQFNDDAAYGPPAPPVAPCKTGIEILRGTHYLLNSMKSSTLRNIWAVLSPLAELIQEDASLSTMARLVKRDFLLEGVEFPTSAPELPDDTPVVPLSFACHSLRPTDHCHFECLLEEVETDDTTTDVGNESSGSPEVASIPSQETEDCTDIDSNKLSEIFELYPPPSFGS